MFLYLHTLYCYIDYTDSTDYKLKYHHTIHTLAHTHTHSHTQRQKNTHIYSNSSETYHTLSFKNNYIWSVVVFAHTWEGWKFNRKSTPIFIQYKNSGGVFPSKPFPTSWFVPFKNHCWRHFENLQKIWSDYAVCSNAALAFFYRFLISDFDFKSKVQNFCRRYKQSIKIIESHTRNHTLKFF